MTKLTHIDEQGNVKMIDITSKKQSLRQAIAQAEIFMSQETIQLIMENKIIKGNVLETARIAGIMAAKNTSRLIPMCHPLNLTHVKIDFFPDRSKNSILAKSSVSIIDATGVEMEALTAVSIASLTIYDMCKSYDKAITISNVCLLKKTGGKSKTFIRGK